MQYTLNLPANGAQRIDVVGSYLKLVRCTAASVRVVTDYGRLDLEPGRGFRLKPGEKFTSVIVTNPTAVAVSGLILAGDFDLIDDRISGEVAVVTQGREKALAGRSFHMLRSSAAVAARWSHVALGTTAYILSGTRLQINAIAVSSPVAGQVRIANCTTQPGGTGIGLANKLVGGGTSEVQAIVGDLAALNDPSLGTVVQTHTIDVAANTLVTLPLVNAIVLDSTRHLIVQPIAVNTGVAVLIDAEEFS